MRLVLIWFFLSLVVAVIANEKGRSAWRFFWLTMLLSPPIGFLFVLLTPPSPKIQETRGLKSGVLKKCLYCFAVHGAQETVCRSCHRPWPDIIDVEATVEK